VIERFPPGEAAATDSEVHDGLRINIRLLPGVHGALFGELVGVSRGFRTARAIQLMTIGLMHERARTVGTPTSQAPPDTPTEGPGPPASAESREENRLFVSAVLESSAEEQ
jgi:hypothetical protein